MGQTKPASRPPSRDAADGIPDRAARRPLWKYLLVGVGLLAWLGALVTLYWAGRP